MQILSTVEKKAKAILIFETPEVAHHDLLLFILNQNT